MTVIELTNIWCEMMTDNEQLLEIAEEECSYEVAGWEHIRKFKIQECKDKLMQAESKGARARIQESMKYWAEWEGRFGINREVRTSKGGKGIWFPTGLLDRILLRVSLETDVTIPIKDKRQPWDIHSELIKFKSSFKARNYQQECIDHIRKNHIMRGIIKSPTGSGKTIMGAMLIKEHYVPTLIIVDKAVLIKQWKDMLLSTLDIQESEIGIVQGKRNFNPSYITIVTQQSLNKWRKDFTDEWFMLMNLHGKDKWGQVIRDEVHHAGSPDGYDTMMQINALYRWGFSATPEDRQDQNLKQIGCIGDIIYSIGAEWLIAHEFLAKPLIRFIPTERLSFDWWDKYQHVYKEAIVNNLGRNRLILHQAGIASRKGSVLIFVDLIEHGIILESLLMDTAPMYGYTVEFVYGNHTDREGVFSRFHSKETKILIATEGLIGEGYDYKDIDTVIIANGGKAAIRTIQKMGRGMRVTETKRTVDVIDFADRCKYLGAHARDRVAVWRQWKFDPDISAAPWLE